MLKKILVVLMIFGFSTYAHAGACLYGTDEMGDLVLIEGCSEEDIRKINEEIEALKMDIIWDIVDPSKIRIGLRKDGVVVWKKRD